MYYWHLERLIPMRTSDTPTYRVQNPVTDEIEETFGFIPDTDLDAAIAQAQHIKPDTPDKANDRGV